MEHIDIKVSLDSNLEIGYICSIGICSRKRVISEKRQILSPLFLFARKWRASLHDRSETGPGEIGAGDRFPVEGADCASIEDRN